MPNGPTLADAIRGLNIDPLVRAALWQVDYPEYILAEYIRSGGLDEVHRRMSTAGQAVSAGVPEEQVLVILEQCVREHVAPRSGASAANPESAPPRPPSIFSNLSKHFPPPIVAKKFFRRGDARRAAADDDSPVVFEERAPLDMEATRKAAFLLRAQGALDRHRRGSATADQAIQDIAEGLLSLMGGQHPPQD